MGIDWHTLLIPQVSAAELIIRGSVMYLMLFALLRALGRRHVGSLSLMDLLLIVLIADAAQNAMASSYRSLPEGMILCGTLIGWSYLLDWLAFRFAALRPWLEPAPLPLIRDGQLQRRNMRHELITTDELMSHLRLHGIQKTEEVTTAYIESDGQISIIKADATEDDPPNKQRAGAQ
jgi:uncharacterized membrane protein YcaP (DUF421 family)